MRHVSLLIKPASALCNMRCKYCFYADISDIREVKSYGIMTAGILETIVKKSLEEATHFCSFGFQGGEPTLAGLGFFKNLVDLVQKYNHKKIAVSYSIQTNGILIDDEWAAFFSRNNFLVGLSLDAEKKTHDQMRLDSDGKGTHNKVLNAAKIFNKHNVQFNILSVITRKLAEHPDNAWNFYKRNQFNYLQFIPCLDEIQQEHGKNSYSLTPQVYGSFLCRIFDLWYNDYIKGNYISVRSFDNYVSMLMGNPPENCAMSGHCQPYLLLEADGSVYPCDFYALDEFRLGNIQTNTIPDMLNCDKAKLFADVSLQTHEDCHTCRFYAVCRGGCRRDREPVTNGVLPLNHYCEAYKMFFGHALPRLLSIAEKEKAYIQRRI